MRFLPYIHFSKNFDSNDSFCDLYERYRDS
jgi:hypothetical protein